ncbi:hypothetical protein Fcan01_25631 [Folsomia candida]|uniref:Uncharacterized protein n=1 Tax=Folsomia candida TaxID=158441 RepID=A0A226D392_FOLCA|nr:hypothetical protein Fcan01_25631 [Folsomia candida]
MYPFQVDSTTESRIELEGCHEFHIEIRPCSRPVGNFPRNCQCRVATWQRFRKRDPDYRDGCGSNRCPAKWVFLVSKSMRKILLLSKTSLFLPSAQQLVCLLLKFNRTIYQKISRMYFA